MGGYCEHCGSGPECCVCGRGRHWPYDVYVQLVAAGWDRDVALLLARWVV